MLSEKKLFAFSGKHSLSVSYIRGYISSFKSCFRAHHFDNTDTAINYVIGLLKCPKGESNMERMEEEVPDSEYRAYQHFLSNSNWDYKGLQTSLAIDISDTLDAQKKVNKKPTGYIIDESSHLKKGKESVGVSRQYAGVIGKVDNCQVGVYVSLVNTVNACIVNERLFLPKSWTENKVRCDKTEIPKEYQQYKTKPELALDMIKEDIGRGVKFDWIGGDGLYGHNTELCKGIDKLGKFFVMDVHRDERVFQSEPSFSIPTKTKTRGRKPTRLKADKQDVRLDELYKNLTAEQWRLESIRDTVKGRLELYVYKTNVWIWDSKSEKATRRTLIITKTNESKPKVKYSFSNGEIEQYTYKEYAYFVAQRYWVERTFDNAKNELGMSGYQARKWKSWHHHHSLVMLTALFIIKQQLDNQEYVPLLSFKDTRLLLIMQIFDIDIVEEKRRLKQMKVRHQKRKRDIELSYEKQRRKKQNLTS